MLSVEDLKKRRNEWVCESGAYTLLDANDCVVRVSRVYPDATGRGKWGYAWSFINSPFGLPTAGATLFDTAEQAMRWADEGFVDHFEWFEVAA